MKKTFFKKSLAWVLTLMMVITFMPPVMSFADAGDTPEHGKTATPNGDGTIKLELSVTGDAETEVETAANVNVLIVYDESSSMTSNNVTTNPNRNRADYAEDVVHDFIEALRGYQNESDPSNIQVAVVGFGPNATTRQTWSTNLTGTGNNAVNRFFDDGVDGQTTNSHNYGQNNGTNWQAALTQAQSVLNDLQNDYPTFVILVTDGAPTAASGQTTINPNGNHPWTDFRVYYNAATTPARNIQSRENTTLFGIYAYGREADLLDDLIYYSNTGNHRTIDGYSINTATAGQHNFGATEGVENYYNAVDTAALTAAIESIFGKIVEALGVSQVAISDGTTNQVETSSGEISELLEVDTSSYQYWLSIPVDSNNQFQRVNMVSGVNETYTVTDNRDGTCTVTWGSNSITVNGSVALNKFKYEWTGANALYDKAPPAAEFVNGAVDWDLPFVLLDGVTYSVTFDVYPSQTTLDIVADIKNDPYVDEDNPGAWGKLDENIRKYIDEQGNLETNTTASITWEDTRPGAEGGSTTFENPDAVESDAVEMLTVTKEWENEIDSRDQPPVTLTVTRDGEDTYTVTLGEDDVWSDSVYISIGIMGEDGKPLKGSEGHDFTFTEPQNLSYHWEINVPVVHPMLINGEKTMLIKVDDKHPKPDGATTYEFNDATYYVDEAAVALTATNERRSRLYLSKAVEGEDVPEDATFPFTLNVVNSLAPETEPEDDPDHESDWWVWISARDKDGNAIEEVEGATRSGATSSWWYAPSGEDITIQAQAGCSIMVNNVASGTTYTITEGDLPTGFIYDKTELDIDGDGTDSTFNGARTTTGTVESTNSEYYVTFTNKYELVDINVNKVWDDNSDQDGIRPDELELTLNGLPDGTEEPEPEITGTDGDTWTYTWKAVPRYDGDGEEIEYSVTEGEVPDGYTCEETTVADGGTITNTHTPETTEISVEKVWVGPIGEAVTVVLYAGETATQESITLNADNEWKGTFEDLPVYEAGEKIVYSVVEESVSGVDADKYDTEITGSAAEGYVITNTNTETVDVTVTKTWDDASNQDGIRPTELALTLNNVPDGTTVADPEITKSGDNWTYEWTGLPKYTADGTEIAYTVTEGTVPEDYTCETTTVDAGGTITNKHVPATTEIAVEKKWVGPAGDEVTVTLYADDVATDQTLMLNSGNQWKGTFEGLDVNNAGTPIVYTVVEDGVSGVDADKYDTEITGSAAEGYVITNTNTETVDVTVTKTWDDASNQDGVRPTELALTLNNVPTGVTVPTPTITKSGDNWTYEWKGLPKYTADGTEIAYTVTEGTVPKDYTCETTTVDAGGTITNKHVPATTEIAVEKKWIGPVGQAVSVVLYIGETATDKTVTLNEESSWKGKFENLPVFEAGVEIVYSVVEASVTGVDASKYSTNITGNAEEGFIITNTLNTGSLTITKTITGLPAGSAPEGLKFTVTGPDYNEEYAYSDFTDGAYTIEDLAVGQYTVVESGTDYSGYTLDAKTQTQKTVTVEKDQTATAAFTNAYKKNTPPSPPDIPDEPIPLDLNGEDHFAYIEGYPDGTVQPEGNITRAEVATMIYRLLTFDRRDEIFTDTCDYSDVEKRHWFNKAVSSMTVGEYVNGYPNGSFKPNQAITRAEFVTIVVRFLEGLRDAENPFTDVDGHWALPYILSAVDAGWIDGYPDGTFHPNDPIKRNEAMKIMNTILHRGINEESELGEPVMFPDNADPSAWYYYEVIEATNDHETEGERPDEDWLSNECEYVYDIVKYERPDPVEPEPQDDPEAPEDQEDQTTPENPDDQVLPEDQVDQNPPADSTEPPAGDDSGDSESEGE